MEATLWIAVICSSDSLAIGVHNAMGRAGFQPGTDIALSGFDGLRLALTSVRLRVVGVLVHHPSRW